MRGDGSLFKRGDHWWISYYRDGRRHRESLNTSDEDIAKDRAQKLRKSIERGEHVGARMRRVTVDDLLDDLLTHLRLQKRAYAPKAAFHVKPLTLSLGQLRASRLTTADVERYQEMRRESEKRAPATINRECELLRQAFRLAARRQPPKVKAVPYIPMLPVDNARQGFLSRADVDALLAALPDPDIRDFVEWFWWTAMRPNEIRQLSWDMYDRETMVLNLEPRITKTRRPRSLAITGPLQTIIERRDERRRTDCTLIFQRRGLPIVSFTKSWAAALKVAKLATGLRPYDLRRSAIRNMVRAGVHERVVMTVSGHRTRTTFDRYNITSAADVKDAIEKTATYVGSLPTERNVAVLRTADTPEKTGTTRAHSRKARR